MASSNEVEEQDDCTVISLNLGIPKENLMQIAETSEDASIFAKKVRESLQQQTEKEAKWRTEMTALRRARVNAEQQFAQIEKQLIACSNKLDVEAKKCENLTTDLEHSEISLSEAKKKVHDLESIKEDALANYSKVAKANELLENEKLELLAVLDRKTQEVQGLNDEWKNMSEKLAHANAAKFKAEARLDEIESQETSFSFRENRLKQEADLLKEQNNWLNEELKKKTEELSDLKKNKASQILELQSNLEEKSNEVNHLKVLSEESKKKQRELEGNIESYMDKLKEARFQLVKSEENYKLELASQSKLSELYKHESEVNQSKAKDMLTAMKELQELLKTSEEGNIDLKSKMQESEEFNSKTVTEMETKISKLENELKNSNELLEAARRRGLAPMTSESLAEMSPVAAATSSLLKSGMTLTEIYSEYVQVSDELQQEKDENSRLKSYMEQILKELEEKAPILQQQKKDYEQVLHSNEKLTKKLESAILEHDHAIVQSEQLTKECLHLRRENGRLESLSADLSHQVQILLKECEDARAGRQKTTHSVYSEEVSSSSQVISDHLVSFRSIEELQQQNQKLLAVIREISQEKESQESENTDDKLRELKNQLDVALKEVESVKLERSRQMEMVELMVRQRDSYRVLLGNRGQSPISMSAQETSLLMQSPSVSDKSLVAVEQTRDALRDLQKHFEDYKDERRLAEDKLNERLESMSMENARLHGENSKLKSQVEFAEERYKMLQSNFESCKKETSVANEKAQHLHLTNVKLQAFADSVSQELAVIKDRLYKAEVTCENLNAEKSMLRDSEVRLLQENKSLLEQQKGTNTLVTNLQKMQNQLERNEFETRTRLDSQIEGLQKDLTLAKRKLESEDSHSKNLVRKLENQVQELRTQIDTETKHHRITKDDLVANTRQMEVMENKYKEAKAQWEAAERRLNEFLTREQAITGDDAEKANKEIISKYEVMLQESNHRLKEAENKITGLEELLKKSKMQEDQFKSMSLAHEEALKSLNAATDEIQSNMHTRLKEAEETNSYFQGQVQGLESRNNALILEKSNLEKESNRQVAELQNILSTIRSELEEARMKARSASAGEQMAREELNEQAQLANECRQKYETEMELHAKDLKELTSTKQKLQELDMKYSEIINKANSDEARLKAHNESLEQQQKHHALEVEKLQARCGDLVNQNSNLHKELDKVVSQLASGEHVSAAVPSTSGEDAGEENKSLVELWEIIRFVRKEKEVSDTKAEMAATESLRYQQRCEFLEKKLQSSQENLNDEKTQEQIDAETAAKHAEVMEKVEKLNELTQANKVLAGEIKSLEQKNKALETKVKKAESEIQTLKDTNRSVTAIKDSLLGEKSALKNEIMRWTTKTNNLLEQYKNINPEEYKRMLDEKKLFQQQIASLKTENQKTKVQLETVKNNLASTSEEISALQKKQSSLTEENDTLKTEASKHETEMQTLKKTLSEKTHEIKEKITTLNKVKRIARQYKSQHDELKKKHEEVQQKAEPAEPQATTTTTADATPRQEANPEGPSEAVDVSVYENQIKELKQQVETLEEQVKSLKAAEEQLKAQFKEKEDKNKKVFIQVKERIQQLSATKEKQDAEKEELKKVIETTSKELEKVTQDKKEFEMKLKALQSQYDGRLAKHEKELKESKASKESNAEESQKKLKEKNSEIEQLQQQVVQQQKLIQQLQQTKTIAAVTSTGAEGIQPSDSVSGSSATVPIVPPTATIKPTSSTAVKPASTKTASIRPMTQSTPTATVLPTVTSSAQETAMVPPRGQATVVSTSSMSATVRPINSGQLSEAPDDVISQRSILETPSTSRSLADTTQPSTSTKRQREEESDRPNQGQGAEPVVKKIRTSEIGEAAQEAPEDTEEEKWEVPELETEPSGRDTPEIVLIESGDEDEGQEEADRDEEMEDEEEEEEEEDDEEYDDEGKATIDVVEVIDDDDEEVGDVEDEEDVDDNQGDGYDEEQDYNEEDVEEDVEEEEEDEPKDVIGQGDVRTGIMEGDDEEDITGEEEVSIPEDDQQGEQEIIQEEAETSQSGSSNNGSTSVSQTSVRQLTPVTTSSQFVQQQQQQEEPGPVGRSTSIDRPPRSHLAPFSFPPGQSSQVPFDDADDCTVPSTPTLFVPKRTDGFAEAISSPHIHRPFNFAPPTEGSSGMQILGLESSITEGGMRVDDTHVNLMDETEESSDGATGLQDRNNKQSGGNQSVPEQAQNVPTESTSRQQSLESLESEDDFSSAIISDVPSITITPAATVLTITPATAEETAEQNVPETLDTPGGDDAVMVSGEDGNEDVGDPSTSTDKDSEAERGTQSGSASSSQTASATGPGPTRIKRFIKRFARGRGTPRGRGRGGNGRGGGASSST